MVVEHADRFGLSQLHQLRGRVGRGAAKSSCYLRVDEHPRGDVAERLRVMTQTNDGFRIAEMDLQERGWDAATPAAILWGAMTPESSRWTGSLAELDDAGTPPGAGGAPGTIVIGAVVSLAAILQAEPSRPSGPLPMVLAAGLEGERYARQK